MAKLNLDPIIAKLCHPTKGLGWMLERAKHAAEQYRRWLWLFTQSPRLSPSADIDSVWHMHILDTRKYEEDCLMMFGHAMHHNPYSGWESDEAEAEHQENYRRTCQLYAEHFGEQLSGNEGICDGGCYGKCDNIQETEVKPIWRPTLSDIREIA